MLRCPYSCPVTTCARCGHELEPGRFCLNCGHPVGEPVPEDELRFAARDDATLPDQVAPRTPSWLPWAAGALLVVILLSVLASFLGGDDDDPAGTAVETTRTTSSGPAGKAARVVDLTGTVQVSAPAAAPATTDLDGELVGYDARRMLDDSRGTAWRTPGDATGRTITFTLAEPSTISRIGLINGYAKQVRTGTGLVDWYLNNRRITAVEWVFDDGTTIRHVLSEVPELQRLEIEPVTTSTVQLRLMEITPPGAGVLGRDYTAISDILIAGSPAA